MHLRIATAATIAAVALALSGCAVAASPPTDTAPTVASSASPSTDGAESTDAADSTAAGAYLDYTDGVIEETAGPKALFFHATWCPQCRTLDDALLSEGAPAGLTVFKVDFDDRVDLRQQYGVTLQTTIVFVDDDGDAVSSVVLYDDPSVESLAAAIP